MFSNEICITNQWNAFFFLFISIFVSHCFHSSVQLYSNSFLFVTLLIRIVKPRIFYGIVIRKPSGRNLKLSTIFFDVINKQQSDSKKLQRCCCCCIFYSTQRKNRFWWIPKVHSPSFFSFFLLFIYFVICEQRFTFFFHKVYFFLHRSFKFWDAPLFE